MRRDNCPGANPRHEAVNVEIGSQGKRMRIASGLIARRAHEIFESRGVAPFDDTKDWLSAEAEILRPLPCVYFETGGKIVVTTNIVEFDKNELVVSVEPSRVVVSGKIAPRAGRPSRFGAPGELVFLKLKTPFELEPSRANARLKNCILEIELWRAGPMKMQSKEANAA